jgi:serine/threonine-protein kinase
MGGGATVAGQLKGKVSYMAPEQVRGEAIDRRVDIFAMGIVLYALTTGKHPFRRESEAATMYTIASDEAVVSPRKFLPEYPASLEAPSFVTQRPASSNGRSINASRPTSAPIPMKTSVRS